jgi:DNA-directed RNA polymerase subunit RPC12/RpoP
MSQVLELKNYRKGQEKPKRNGWEYFCPLCDKSLFQIKEGGLIVCASCGVAIKNLMAVAK